MNLARNKNGQVGRKLQGSGFDAKIERAPMGEATRNVYVSSHSIEEDARQIAAEDERQIARARAQRMADQNRRTAQDLIQQAREHDVEKFQQLAKYDPMNEKLRAHFAAMGRMSEESKVVNSLYRTPAPIGPAQTQKPANFSADGGNPQIVSGADEYRGNWRADFRMEKIVGNPLTRDGRYYGNDITDYPVYVPGTDVFQDNEVQVVGGTMLGRLNDVDIKKRHVTMGNMGDEGSFWDFMPSWGDIGENLSNVASGTLEELQESLPEQLAKELQEAITGGGQVTSSGGGVINVTRPITTAVNSASSSMGVPPWVLYTGLGMMGVGLLAVLYKAVK